VPNKLRNGLRDGLAANEADQAGEDQLAAELHDLKEEYYTVSNIIIEIHHAQRL
jgi:hypothetical protein